MPEPTKATSAQNQWSSFLKVSPRLLVHRVYSVIALGSVVQRLRYKGFNIISEFAKTTEYTNVILYNIHELTLCKLYGSAIFKGIGLYRLLVKWIF